MDRTSEARWWIRLPICCTGEDPHSTCMTCRMFKNPFTTANTHGLPLSLSKAHMTKGDLQSLDELFLASERMVVCKFRPPSILTAIVTLLRSFYCFNKEFPKCDAGSEKNVFPLLGLPVLHFHFQWNMFSMETPQRNQLSQTMGLWQLTWNRHKLPRRQQIILLNTPLSAHVKTELGS